MKIPALLLAGVIVSCGAPAALATPTPQIVYVTPSPAHSNIFGAIIGFSHRSFTVDLVTMRGEEPLQMRSIVSDQLAPAWNAATMGRSQLQVTERGSGDVYMMLMDNNHPTLGGQEVNLGTTPLTMLYVRTPLRSYIVIRAALHEIGHALGCCHGTGSDGAGHVDCSADAKPIMCSDVGDAATFNDYELSQMGLGTP